jgi:hypothetical protein
MIPEKENPVIDGFLAEESKNGADDASGLPGRLDRYSKAHHRSLEMSNYAFQQGDVKLSRELTGCGHFLLFHHYYTIDKVRLHAAKFCRRHLLCPLCAIRRGAKQVQAYLSRLEVIRAQHPDLQLSLVTLTVKNQDDLVERHRHISQAFRRMQHARRAYLQGRGPYVEMAKALGAVGSYEAKIGKGSGLWHPHIHMVVLHREPLDVMRLRSDWLKYSADSFMVDVTPFYSVDPVEGFLEVFKYGLKFSDMPLDKNWSAYKALRGKRLIFSFGLFRGVEVPEDMTDDDLEDLPYVQLLYRFAQGAGYSFFTGHTRGAGAIG